MSFPEWNELEIVGFNGAPLVECGRSLPVARRKADRMHCVLELRPGGPPPAWYAEEEAAAYAADQHWTMFEKPLLLPRSCPAPNDRFAAQPMVVFADDGFLDYADRISHCELWDNEYLMWRQLKDHPASVRAACASAEAVESLLDDWAASLIKRFDATFRLHQDGEYLRRIADYALSAARSRSLRWRAHLRHAAAQEPDCVRRTFDRVIRREFPAVVWDDFMREVRGFVDAANALPAPAPEPAAPSSSGATARPKIRGMAAMPPVSLLSTSRLVSPNDP